MACSTCPDRQEGGKVPDPIVCPEHSGIVTWLKGGGVLFSIFMLTLITIATMAYIGLQKYKLLDTERTGAMAVNIKEVNGSVALLENTVTLKMDSMSKDITHMNDRQTASNEALARTISSLTESLERKGIFARTPLDTSTLLIADYYE